LLLGTFALEQRLQNAGLRVCILPRSLASTMKTFRLFSALLLSGAVAGLILSTSVATRSPAQSFSLAQTNKLLGSVDLKTKTAILRVTKAGKSDKEARIRYPVVSGLSDATLLQKVQDAISLKKVIGQSLAEMEQEYQTNHWLSDVDYTVNYNRNHILDLTYSVAGVGAYPDGFEKYVSIDLKTGKRLKAKDLFKADTLAKIVQIVDQMRQREVQKKIVEAGWREPALRTEFFTDHQFKAKNLDDFTIADKGITFHYDFEFPHVVKAVEPSGEYFLPYTQLTRYLRQDGALGFIVGRVRSPK
jgi:hypothetical protein